MTLPFPSRSIPNALSCCVPALQISSGAKSWEGFDQIFKESRLVSGFERDIPGRMARHAPSPSLTILLPSCPYSPSPPAQVHVTTVDFLTCSALAPFWVWNDAQAREWESPLLPVVLGVPFVGPALYLALRPRKTK